ncbi:hypothetical protein [Marinobacter subterrani]|uniref:hypothetical protein n=1 Tax=Marinobacter subterrani TaxID=1658765 RepID=UPI0023525930|nr:hypothetical protein [Marinobacter subterrani]
MSQTIRTRTAQHPHTNTLPMAAQDALWLAGKGPDAFGDWNSRPLPIDELRARADSDQPEAPFIRKIVENYDRAEHAARKRHPTARNLTEYARSIGYTGDKAVMVQDGRVVSHQKQDWFRFCERCRAHAV